MRNDRVHKGKGTDGQNMFRSYLVRKTKEDYARFGLEVPDCVKRDL